MLRVVTRILIVAAVLVIGPFAGGPHGGARTGGHTHK